VIGITAGVDEKYERCQIPLAYIDAVRRAGGVPLLIPPTGEGFPPELFDGLLLTGGVDLDPAYYREEPRPGLGAICPDRDGTEIELVRVALERGTPLLAICRGVQVLNVAAGGDLYQDLSSRRGALKHYQDAPGWHASHGVAIERDSLLWRILRTEAARVNSFHHQSVRLLGAGLVATAYSPDGVVEALEGRRGFVLGVQWHPERMWPRCQEFEPLFGALVAAAGGGEI